MSDTIAASRIRLPRVLRARDPQAVETSQRQAHCSTKTLAPRYRTSDIHRDGTRHITQRTLIAFVRIGPARRVHDLPGPTLTSSFPSSSRHSRKDCAAVLIAQELHACTSHASAGFCCLAKRQDRRCNHHSTALCPFTAGSPSSFLRNSAGGD
jgi:hypothetical protein